MEKKLLNFASLMYVCGVVLLLMSYIFNGVIEKSFLFVSLVSILVYLIPYFKYKLDISNGSKVFYFTFIFWVLSRIFAVYRLTTISLVFSGITMLLALWIVINSTIYISKYCNKSIDDHLDEL